MNLLAAIRRIMGFTGSADAPPSTLVEFQAGYDPNGDRAVPLAIAARGLIDTEGNAMAPGQKVIADTSYTLSDADNGLVLLFTAPDPVTVTVTGTLKAQFSCAVFQEGLGDITFGMDGGATIGSFDGNLKTAGQYAHAYIYVPFNTDGASAAVRIGGTLTA